MDLLESDPVKKKDLESFMKGIFNLAITEVINLNHHTDTTILFGNIQKGATEISYDMLYKMYLYHREGKESNNKLENLEKYLSASIYVEDMEMAMYLLEKGADPRKKDPLGISAMDDAIKHGNIEMIELFQSYDLAIKEPSE